MGSKYCEVHRRYYNGDDNGCPRCRAAADEFDRRVFHTLATAPMSQTEKVVGHFTPTVPPVFKPVLAASALPTDAVTRKSIPVYSGFIKYFPRAMAEVAECSSICNEQHNPGTPLHWDRSKSGDELDALTRHLLEAGTIDTDGVRHSTKLAWRAMANLEKELEAAADV